MSLLSRRKNPNFLRLLCGLAAGGFCGSALVTGKFLMPLNRLSYRFPFVLKAQDPRLFQFWILISSFYCLALCLIAFVRVDPLESWAETLPQFGRIRMTGRPRPHVTDALFGLTALLVLYVAYVITMS